MKALIVVFASLAALSDAFGTFTVWKSFVTTSAAVDGLRSALLEEAKSEIPLSNTYEGINQAAEEISRLRKRYRDNLERLMKPLAWNRLSAAGLIAFFAGAVFGLAAALVAIA
jgi:hypothetical protein